MISQFQKRLIIMTTSFVAIILVIAFITIFITTYFRIESDNLDKLYQLEELRITSNGEVRFDEPKPDDALVINRIIPGAGIYFNLFVDENGKIVAIDSALKMGEKQYAEAARVAWDNKKGGTVEIAGREWQYVNFPTDSKLNYGGSSKKVSHVLRFLDTTDSKKSLVSLAITLLLVGSVLLIFFFLVIVYFAKRAIKPITEGWEKQQRFITDASHELKTPLSIILANIDVLYESQEETIHSQIKWLDYIAKGSMRMNALVNDLLTQARMDSNSPEEQLDKKKVTLDHLLEELISTYESRFLHKNIQVKTVFAPCIIKTDPDMLRKLCDILLDNALKYSNDGGIVDVKLLIVKQSIVITVKNTGEGITEEHLAKLFDRFYRVDESRFGDRSYGLGLSIARSIVERLEGEIQVESVLDSYTLFSVKLPKSLLT